MRKEKTISESPFVKEEDIRILHLVYTTVNKFVDVVFFDVDQREENLSWADNKRKVLLIKVRMRFNTDLTSIFMLLDHMSNG